MRREKLSTLVTFPTRGLDLSPFISSDREGAAPRPVYDLIATADHVGDRDASGHYVASCLGGDEWHRFDDSRVGPTSPDQLQGPEAYVLWYRLRES